ncbi:PP2C family protein-serine/threonine phosphatase [Streptomyces sp. NPDC002889]|uniref:PP2C family protein-serine/threonine phosphatase n=1 Tax=Streptomyces sp. NPDC002889 TaxID=3364669 RepID=UPI0036A9917A
MTMFRRGPLAFPQAVAALLLLGGAAADLFGPQPYMGLPLLAAAPLIACVLLTFRIGLAFAVLACVLSIALDLYLRRPATALFVDLADVLIVSTIALGINRLLHRQGRYLAQARDVAEAVQRAVLPDPPSRAGPLAVAARYETAQAEARIGGDLYAVQPTPYGVRAIIGDVRGKGLQAVSSVSVIVGAFRQEAEQAPTLAELAHRLDSALARESDRGRETVSGFEDFTTAVLVQIPSDGDAVQLVNRGHPAPFLVEGGTVVQLEPASYELPLGMRLPETGAGGDVSATDVFTLRPGASLLLVTDGVTEARNQHGRFYDPCTQLPAGEYSHPSDLVDALAQDVSSWTGNQRQDDMAILALTRTENGSPERTA